MHTRMLATLAVSIALGITLEEFLRLGMSFALFSALLAVVVGLVVGTARSTRSRLMVSLAFVGLALGVARVSVSQDDFIARTHMVASQVGKMVSLRGIIVDEPDVREEYTNLVLEAREVLDGGERRALELSPRVLVRVPAYPTFAYGDEVSVRGTLVLPKNIPAENGKKEFDYRAYLAKDGISYQVYFPTITLVSHDQGNPVRAKLVVLKGMFMRTIAHMLPEPEASLAAGVTLGVKQSLGTDLMRMFRETGVAHIVVLSGYNIAVVASIVSRMTMFVPFALRLAVSAVAIVLFAVMVGGGATVVRATAMALVVILARALGRAHDALRALVIAGVLMVLVNPAILLHDVSFQLSFVATLAIVILVPLVERYFVFIRAHFLREVVVATVATQVAVLPLILYHMGSVSLVGFVANIFVVPVVPIAMVLVGAVVFLAWVPGVGGVVAFAAHLVLAYIVHAVEFFARVPYASLAGVSFPFAALAGAYLALGVFVYRIRRRDEVSQKREYEF